MVDGKPEAKVLGQTTAEGFGTYMNNAELPQALLSVRIAADTLTNAHLSEGVQAVSAAAEKIKDLPMDEVAGQIQDTAKAMHDVTQYVRQLPLDEATKSIRTAADATTTTAESANAALKVGRGLLHAATAVQAVSIPLMCINAYNQKIEATAKTKQAEILACQVHLEHESRTYGLSPTARAQSFLDICEHWDCYVRKKFLEDRPSSTVKTYLVGVSTVDLTPLWKLAEKKQGFRDLLVVPTKPGYETFQEAIDAADAHTNRRSQDQKRTDTYHIFILISDGEPRLCRPETHHVAIPHSLAPKDLFIVGLGSKGKKSAHAIDERSTVETELARRSPFCEVISADQVCGVSIRRRARQDETKLEVLKVGSAGAGAGLGGFIHWGVLHFALPHTAAATLLVAPGVGIGAGALLLPYGSYKLYQRITREPN